MNLNREISINFDLPTLSVNPPIVERYVDLCLRVDEHIEDFVDAYIGPSAVRDRILAEGIRDPRLLHDDAVELLEETARAELEEDRVQWLLGQLRALECVTARLAGEEITWADEVERCFGIRPQHVDEELFRASHKRLDEVLPGSGDLSARYNAWIDAAEVPRDMLSHAIEVLSAELRRRTRQQVELPSEEKVEYDTVTGQPWQAFNWYRGDYSSLVQVNLDLPFSIVDLVDLVAHESYPGHHTERACKERYLYRDRGRVEMSVMITSAPEAVIAEGIATNALEEAMGDDGIKAILELPGFRVDASVAEVVFREEWRLFAAATNAAPMLHDNEITPSEAETYLKQWALYSPERASKTVAFLLDPGSLTYVTAYTDGKRLCRSFIDRHRDGFRRLLTEQLTVSSLQPDS
jgi:hypothetical protein